MQVVSKQLGQLRKTAAGTPEVIFTMGNVPVEIMRLTICNNSSSYNALVAIYHDDDGTTYDASTRTLTATLAADYAWNDAILAQFVGGGITIQPGGSLAFEVRSGTSPDVTVTAYGIAKMEEQA